MTRQQAKISVKNLYKAFGAKKVLDDFNLEIEAGKSLVIMGGSGSGKSVFLKCVLGLIAPDQGSILVDAEETVRISARKRDDMLRKFGMVFQGGALFDSMTVGENIIFGLKQRRGVTKSEGAFIIDDTLKKVGLSPQVAALLPASLSGGMQKRVALARALALKPEILFFDEPTAGLDPIMSSVINHLIAEVVREIGATAVTITHDMRSMREIGDRVMMLYEGKNIWSGSPKEAESTDHPVVRQFVNGHLTGPVPLVR
jgi:phospholipid/cholesterol/gamma-HCH transport system ATP-binding protein